MASNGLMPPFQYAWAASLFNKDVLAHNKQRPTARVQTLPLNGGQP